MVDRRDSLSINAEKAQVGRTQAQLQFATLACFGAGRQHDHFPNRRAQITESPIAQVLHGLSFTVAHRQAHLPE